MTDDELISHALTVWANHIETGTVTLSASDASAQNAARKPSDQLRISSLNPDQVKLVRRLRSLSSAHRPPTPISAYFLPEPR